MLEMLVVYSVIAIAAITALVRVSKKEHGNIEARGTCFGGCTIFGVIVAEHSNEVFVRAHEEAHMRMYFPHVCLAVNASILSAFIVACIYVSLPVAAVWFVACWAGTWVLLFVNEVAADVVGAYRSGEHLDAARAYVYLGETTGYKAAQRNASWVALVYGYLPLHTREALTVWVAARARAR